MLAFASIVNTTVAASSSKEGTVALKVKELHESAFPLPLLLRGITSGSAEVVVSIDPDGRAVDNLVVAYTQPEFARSALEVLKTSVFEPIKINGEPAAIRAKIKLSFDAEGVVISLTATEMASVWIDRMFGERTTSVMGKLAELDRAPAAMHQVQPRYPAELAKQKVSGRATLDFFVDENGKVRMPTRVRSDNDEFAEASANALMEWQFAPLTRRGEPVIVQMRQEFVFNPKS